MLDSGDVEGVLDLHPAVETVARLLQADPDAGDLATLARAAHLSWSPSESGWPGSKTRRVDQLVPHQQRLQRFLPLYGRVQRTTALGRRPRGWVLGSYAQFYRVFASRQDGVRPLRTAAADEDLSLVRDHLLIEPLATRERRFGRAASPGRRAGRRSRVELATCRSALATALDRDLWVLDTDSEELRWRG